MVSDYDERLKLDSLLPYFIMNDMLFGCLILIAAILYSSVGHAGASGYLAVMALFGLAPETMKPTALALNIVVAALATYRYTRAGQSDGKLLLPFIVTSIPAAFIGGLIHLPAIYYRPLVGGILLLSALQFFITATRARVEDDHIHTPSFIVALFAGACLGLLAGLTGTGGGIFLSPLLLLNHWAPTRRASGIAAGFILVNSIAGLAGTRFSVESLPSALPFWMIAALLGGWIGTWLGTKQLSVPAIRRMLGIVLLIAGGKMLLSS